MDLAPAQLHGSGDNLRVSYGDDKGLLVEFEDDAVYQEYESKIANRAIYKQVPFIRIIVPGDKTKQRYKPATDADKQRFPMQWAAYEKGQHAIGEGTPITEWTYLSKSQALELKHMGFWTVEILANASDMQLNNLLSGKLLRTQAQEFLKGITSVNKENDALKAQLAELQAQIDELKAAPTPERKKPGPKPKNHMEN